MGWSADMQEQYCVYKNHTFNSEYTEEKKIKYEKLFSYTAVADEAFEISEGLDSWVPGRPVRFPLAQEIAG